MSFLKPLAEPWARIVAVLMTFAFAALFYWEIGWEFSAGMGCGAAACALFHWALRIDERGSSRRADGEMSERAARSYR